MTYDWKEEWLLFAIMRHKQKKRQIVAPGTNKG